MINNLQLHIRAAAFLLFPNEGSAKAFERDYIIPVELADNGVVRNPLSTMLASFTGVRTGTDCPVSL